MRLVREVKATSVMFTCACDEAPPSGLYLIDQEVVAMIEMPSCRCGGQFTFYVFRAQQGTAAVGHEVHTGLHLVQAGGML